MMQLAGDQSALFASDMHLGDHDPATAALFMAALQAALAQARPSHLFLLGDLFERWVGDDQPDALADALSALLAAASGQGLQVALMRGNRDFLLGQPLPGAAAGASWPARSGAVLLDDELVLQLHGQRTLLCHGDTLCTADTGYQAFRRMVRAPDWQAGFLARPLAERLAIARDIRERSEQSKEQHEPALMDAQEAAIQARLLAHGASVLIHGHTHLPGEHVHQLPEGRQARRIVLPDWQAASTPSTASRLSHGERGYFLWADAGGLRPWRPQAVPTRPAW